VQDVITQVGMCDVFTCYYLLTVDVDNMARHVRSMFRCSVAQFWSQYKT